MIIRWLFHKAAADFLLASEEVITRAVGLEFSPPTARLNIFDPPAVLIGYNQDVYEEVNVDESKRLGFHVNRRPTGGGTIVMYEDTPGWEIWLPIAILNTIDVKQMYVKLAEIPLRALRYIGIEARLRGKNDIEVGGRKISGTGLYTDSGGLMFCGTLLLDFDVRLMLRLLKLPIEKISDKEVKTFEERITTVKQILGRKPSINEVANAFKKAVAEVLGADVVDGELNKWELEELGHVLERYRSCEWVYGFRSASSAKFTKICTYKTAAGLVRIHVKVFEDVIEQIIITGDFFVYPPNALYELESHLKWSRVDEVPQLIMKFSNSIRILDLSLSELAQLVMKCLRED